MTAIYSINYHTSRHRAAFANYSQCTLREALERFIKTRCTNSLEDVWIQMWVGSFVTLTLEYRCTYGSLKAEPELHISRFLASEQKILFDKGK